MDTNEKKVELVLGFTIVAAIAVVSVLWIYTSSISAGTLYGEYLKLTYQFFLLIVIGAGVTLLFTESVRVRDRNAARKEMYREFLADCEFAYNSAKCIRRVLRGNARFCQSEESNCSDKMNSKNIMIEKNAYQDQMTALIRAQLKFEYLKKLAEAHYIFQGVQKQDELISNLNLMEKYLNHIVDDFEDSFGLFSKTSFVPIKKLDNLREFIDDFQDDSPFDIEFKKPHKTIQYILINLILGKKNDGK